MDSVVCVLQKEDEQTGHKSWIYDGVDADKRVAVFRRMAVRTLQQDRIPEAVAQPEINAHRCVYISQHFFIGCVYRIFFHNAYLPQQEVFSLQFLQITVRRPAKANKKPRNCFGALCIHL